jgi:hypothetical protein
MPMIICFAGVGLYLNRRLRSQAIHELLEDRDGLVDRPEAANRVAVRSLIHGRQRQQNKPEPPAGSQGCRRASLRGFVEEAIEEVERAEARFDPVG